MSKLICAMNSEHIIGVDNALPWHYSGDLVLFHEKTNGGVVIMGRRTYESIGRALPGRLNIVVTRIPINDAVISTTSVHEAYELANEHSSNVWFIGGAHIYAASFKYIDEMIITLVPDIIIESDYDVVRKFPTFPYKDFEYVAQKEHPYEPALKIINYKRSYNEYK